MENVTSNKGKPYRSCRYLESGIVLWTHELAFCCDRKNPATLPVEENADPKQVVDDFLRLRNDVIMRNQSEQAPCEGCNRLQTGLWDDQTINVINFGVQCYCQFSCVYCVLQRTDGALKNKAELYDSIGIVNELGRRGLLSKKLHVDCASGEIAIHPNRNAYFDFVEKYAYSVTFNSNAGKFSQRLADILKYHPNSNLIVSIDAGTRETFRKIRGVDLFEQVKKNLEEYRKYSAQVILKYIILDQNCGEEDINGFLSICSGLNIEHVIISADLAKTWDFSKSSQYEPNIVRAASRMIEQLIKMRVNYSIMESFFGKANMLEINSRLSQLPEIAECEEKLNRILSMPHVVFYGAGKNSIEMVSKFNALGLRNPDCFWDRKANSRQLSLDSVEPSGMLHCGIPVFHPAFELLNGRKDTAVLITLANREINQQLTDEIEKCGFKQYITFREAELALIAKEARRNMEATTHA